MAGRELISAKLLPSGRNLPTRGGASGAARDRRQVIGEASGVGAVIDASAVPIERGATLIDALSGGEDYELVFTIDPSDYDKLVLNEQISVVGYMTNHEQGSTIVTKGGSKYAITAQGWTHLKA